MRVTALSLWRRANVILTSATLCVDRACRCALAVAPRECFLEGPAFCSINQVRGMPFRGLPAGLEVRSFVVQIKYVTCYCYCNCYHTLLQSYCYNCCWPCQNSPARVRCSVEGKSFAQHALQIGCAPYAGVCGAGTCTNNDTDRCSGHDATNLLQARVAAASSLSNSVASSSWWQQKKRRYRGYYSKYHGYGKYHAYGKYHSCGYGPRTTTELPTSSMTTTALPTSTSPVTSTLLISIASVQVVLPVNASAGNSSTGDLSLVSVPEEQSSCLQTEPGRAIGTVGPRGVFDISGIAASQVNRGVYWFINEEESGPLVYGLTKNGFWNSTLRVSGASQIKWGDVAVGPGPEDGKSYTCPKNPTTLRKYFTYGTTLPSKKRTLPSKIITLPNEKMTLPSKQWPCPVTDDLAQ